MSGEIATRFERIFALPGPLDLSNKAVFKIYQTRRDYWGTALVWLFQKCFAGKNLKLDRRNRLVRLMEPFGQYLATLLNICIYIEGKERGLEWLLKCCSELWREDLRVCFVEGQVLSIRAQVEVSRTELFPLLREYQNPVNRETQPWLWRLIESSQKEATSFADKGCFDSDYYRPMVKAAQAWENSKLCSDWYAPSIDFEKQKITPQKPGRKVGTKHKNR